MTITRLKRKHRKNIARANNKQHIIKELLRTPVLKNVDLEELKSRFPATGVAGAVAAVQHTATAAAAAVEDKVEAVAHSSVVENAKEAVAATVDKVKEVAASVAHSDVVEKAKEVVADAVDAVKEAVAGPDATDKTNETAANAAAFDAAEAVTKPVNEDGQKGEHPKPEIAL